MSSAASGAPRPADHFSRQTAAYRAFRPRYPAALFDWLRTLTPTAHLAWDCGCGTGQASADLAQRFARVLATDLSAAQLAAAPTTAGVSYAAARADAAPLAGARVDLTTVAQALHWFDLDAFYAEVRRVTRPGGALACWSYGRCALAETGLDGSFQAFYDEVAGPHWPAERHHVETGYRDLAFPFARIAPPAFALRVEWTLQDVLGYVASWSASVRFEQATGRVAAEELASRWRHEDLSRRVGVRWPLTILAGRP